jgi:hypothetical protein
MKLTDLTPEQKRIAIAEACPKLFRVLNNECHWRFSCEGEESRVDPLSDLNAIHEAVMSLDIVSKRVFAETLRKVCDDELPGNVLGDEFVIQNATAEQRADAFLLATGRAEP